MRSAVSFRLPGILLWATTLRATIATSAPSEPNWMATALPMPRLAPVTIADRPANRFAINDLLVAAELSQLARRVPRRT
jgi:hypothetical protein